MEKSPVSKEIKETNETISNNPTKKTQDQDNSKNYFLELIRQMKVEMIEAVDLKIQTISPHTNMYPVTVSNPQYQPLNYQPKQNQPIFVTPNQGNQFQYQQQIPVQRQQQMFVY